MMGGKYTYLSMRTSKISQDTSRIFNAISANSRSTRSTRVAGKSIATFALGYDGSVEVKQEEQVELLDSTPSKESDIEDIGTPPRSSRKRKRDGTVTVPSTPATVIKTEHKSTWTSPRQRPAVKQEDEDGESDQDVQSSSSPRKSQPKLPAKRAASPGGTLRYTTPSNWDIIYSLVNDFRRAHPIAPVDTMGCEDLYFQASPPQEQRYHTLTALMLSSQTKDTVTAAAMQRLHTELVPDAPRDSETDQVMQSCLTVRNIMQADPKHLDSLIGKVGFHNTKTKHIQLVAAILHNQYSDDIPDTIEGLVSLPGVGPKMAYLCMSAAWKQDVGIGVDVHVHRITNLWGWHNTKTPEQTREWLEGWLPHDRWHEINKMLVGLGQTVCLPIGRRCGECPLFGKSLCKGEVKGWVNKEAGKRKKARVKVDHAEIEMEEEYAITKTEEGGVLEESRVEVKKELL